MSTAPKYHLASFPEPMLPDDLESSEEYRDVLAMTQRLFPGPVGVRREHDPELPEEYVVFDVHAHGTLDEIMIRDLEWHRECGKIAPVAWFLYGLAIAVDHDCE